MSKGGIGTIRKKKPSVSFGYMSVSKVTTVNGEGAERKAPTKGHSPERQ